MANNNNANTAAKSIYGITPVKAGVPSIRPVSGLSDLKKGAKLWAYLDQPAEILALKILDACKASIKAAIATGTAPDGWSYGLSGESPEVVREAVSRFTSDKAGFTAGVEEREGVLYFTFPRGVLEAAKKKAK